MLRLRWYRAFFEAQQLPQKLQFRRLGSGLLDRAEGGQQCLLEFIEVRAGRKERQHALRAIWLQAFGECVRCVAKTVRWNPPFGLDLVDFLRRSQQAGLEERIGNADERLGDLVIVLRAQNGHAVFGDDDVPQVARNRRVPVVEQHVADRLADGVAYRAHHQYRSAGLKLMCLGNEVVLTAHAGYRSEERRVGKNGVSTCRFRWSPEP